MDEQLVCRAVTWDDSLAIWCWDGCPAENPSPERSNTFWIGRIDHDGMQRRCRHVVTLGRGDMHLQRHFGGHTRPYRLIGPVGPRPIQLFS